jgi:hypothetical protein
LLREYQTLAAEGYSGGARAFSDLADVAATCLSNVTNEQRLTAMMLQNVFHNLSEDQGKRADKPDRRLVVSPGLHAALMNALEFVVSGGDPSRFIQVSEQLILASRQVRESVVREEPGKV